MSRKSKVVKQVEPIRLRVGLGEEDGFTKVDNFKSYKDNSVDSIYSAFHFHRLSQEDRWEFMNEAFRVLKPRSHIILVVPYYSSVRAIADPLAKFPPLCENSFMVYSKDFRDREQLSEIPLTCNFNDVFGVGYNQDQELTGRNDEFIYAARKNKLNTVLDIHVTLTKPDDV